MDISFEKSLVGLTGFGELDLVRNDDGHAGYLGLPAILGRNNSGLNPLKNSVLLEPGVSGGAALTAAIATPKSAFAGKDSLGAGTLPGTTGPDYIDGRGGSYDMAGGPGNDTYVVDDASDQVIEQPNEGTDTVTSYIAFSLAGLPNVENLTLLGTANINATGNGLANRLIGNSGNNELDGGTGVDTMTGGLGDDTYYADHAEDNVVEAAGAGTDLVRSAVSFTLAANVENLILTGTNNLHGRGNGLNNVLTGNTGVDLLEGGLGDDTYYVQNTTDNVFEEHGQGTDTVYSTVTYSLNSRAVETLILTGGDNVNATGNFLSNTLTGNSGNNVLDGGSVGDLMTGGLGDDTYYVDNVADVVRENHLEGTDTVFSSVSFSLFGRAVETLILTGASHRNATGNSLNNTLTGNSGNNVLDGAAGGDLMTGGLGDDTYYVDNVADVVRENHAEGTDTVFSSVSFSLFGVAVETLILTGAAHSNATGNGLNNTLTGNSGNNVLDGGTGGDLMTGGLGDDTYYVDNVADIVRENHLEGTDTVFSSVSISLFGRAVETLILTGAAHSNATGNSLNNTLTGNSGNNVLDGGTGGDLMTGGLGDDTYYVDNAADVVRENDVEGNDTVFSSVSFSLFGSAVESLILTGTANLNATGNALVNRLTGNSGNNLLDGGAGVDTLIGGDGNDTYVVQNANDSVIEVKDQGTDLILSSVSYNLAGRYVETLQLTGSDPIEAIGNSLGNILIGNAGDNTLNGLGGPDTLTGGSGADIFLFGANSRADVVTDFNGAEGDVINVNAYTGGVANTSLVSQVGANTVINFGSNNIITILGVNAADVMDHIVW